MKERLPELSTDARSLLEAGRAPEPVPPGVAAHVWGKLAISVPAAPTAPPSPSTSLHLAPAATVKTFALAKLAGVSVAILGAGAGATVAVVHLRARPPSPTIAAQPEPVETQRVAVPIPAMLPPVPEKPPLVPEVPPPTAKTVSAHPLSRSAVPPRAPTAVPEGDLAAERSLIARARSSLEQGSPLDALATLRAHEQRFEKGALAQEREALRIQALIASGNRPAAEAAAARFERDYPQSLMGPAVRAAMRAKP